MTSICHLTLFLKCINLSLIAKIFQYSISAPIADKMRKPKLLKPQPRKVVLVSSINEIHRTVLFVLQNFQLLCLILFYVSCNSAVVLNQQPKIAEESLMYAELELMKPLPEAKSATTGTVYAQILFEDRPV